MTLTVGLIRPALPLLLFLLANEKVKPSYGPRPQKICPVN